MIREMSREYHRLDTHTYNGEDTKESEIHLTHKALQILSAVHPVRVHMSGTLAMRVRHRLT